MSSILLDFIANAKREHGVLYFETFTRALTNRQCRFDIGALDNAVGGIGKFAREHIDGERTQRREQCRAEIPKTDEINDTETSDA